MIYPFQLKRMKVDSNMFERCKKKFIFVGKKSDFIVNSGKELSLIFPKISLISSYENIKL